MLSKDMNRRDFLKYSALTLSPVVVKFAHDHSQPEVASNFEIEILSDAAVGHVLRNSHQYARGEDQNTEYLIVGGGIAGLSAAYQLRDHDFMLCELSERLGGSSSANTHRDQYFTQGAHYDLAYPAYYGKELLQTLFELDVIDFDTATNSWQFVDHHLTIAPEQESITFHDGTFRKDVLPEGNLKAQFEQLLRPFVGQMPMPTTQIAVEHHHLNTLTFYDYLQQHLTLDAEFLQAIDYAMIDDWGAPSTVVSALAGIHYYTCRPYFDRNPILLSPPQGNAYFAQRFISRLPQERLRPQQLIRSIQPNDTGFDVEVVDIKAERQYRVQTRKIVYAAHKHGLKYIYPAGYARFRDTHYSPWLVLNLVLNQTTTQKAYWQNEYVSGERAFLGFVDSAAQFQPRTTRRTLTAYYCFEPEQRQELLHMDENAPALVERTIQYIEQVLKQPIRPHIEKAYIKVMGHGMPIPKPGFLFTKPNHDALETGIAYAGVDTGRLPLFFEAADSGLQAACCLLQEKKLG